MPCYDERNEPKYVIEEARKDFRHNSDVAELLCEAMKIIERSGTGIKDYISRELQVWWLEHQIRDEKRKKL